MPLRPLSVITLTLPTVVVTDSSCPKTAKKRDVAVPTPLDQYDPRILSSACGRLSIVPTASTTLTGIASVAVVSLVPSSFFQPAQLADRYVLKTSTVTAPAATATVCTGCVADGQHCDIYNPGACCGQICFCPSGDCHCISSL